MDQGGAETRQNEQQQEISASPETKAGRDLKITASRRIAPSTGRYFSYGLAQYEQFSAQNTVYKHIKINPTTALVLAQ